MITKSHQITEKQNKALKKLSEKTGAPQAYHIRKAIEQYLQSKTKQQ